MSVTKIPAELSPQDSKQLRQKLIAVVVFLLVAAAMFAFIFSREELESFEGAFYVVIGFGVLFFGIIFYIGYGFARDLFRGEKLLIRGVVTDKRRHKSSKSGSRSTGRTGRRGSSSSSRPTYYLFFGEEEFYVDQKHYDMTQVGQEIELHYAPSSSSSLQIIPLTEDVQAVEHQEKKSIREQLRERKEAIENLPRKEITMSQNDLMVLKKNKNKLLRQRLGFVLTFGFMAVIFTLAGILWWVMAIPAVVLWLLFIGFTKSALKTISKYKKDERSGIKLVVLTKVLDKQHFSGSSYGHSISTGYGSYNVPQTIYDSLEGQEQVFVAVGKYSGWLIEIISHQD